MPMNIVRYFIASTAALLLAGFVSSCSTTANSNSGTPNAASATESNSGNPAAAAGAPAGQVQVPLTSSFNLAGIYPDGATFTGGVDGVGFACSSNLLGATQVWGGVTFDIGPSRAGLNVISCQGQTISLPAGNFSKLEMLAMGVNGAQASQHFTVTYDDPSANRTFTQSLSDWASPDNNDGEAQAVAMDYRDPADGTRDDNQYNIYGYSFALDKTHAVSGLKLPNNENVKVFALTLVP